MMKIIFTGALSLLLFSAQSQSITAEKMKVTAGKLMSYLHNADSVAILELQSDVLDSVKQRKKYFEKLSRIGKQIRLFKELVGDEPTRNEFYSVEKTGSSSSFSRLDVTVLPAWAQNEKRKYFTVIIMFWPTDLHTTDFIYSFDIDYRNMKNKH